MILLPADFQRKLNVFDRAIKEGNVGGYSADQLRAGRDRLIDGVSPAARGQTPLPLADALARITSPVEGMRDVQAELAKLTDAANDNADKVKAANVRVVKSFQDMASETVSKLQGLASAIKGGGFLDILGAVIGFGLQLGSVGAFGKSLQTKINRPVPGFANGTNFAPGGLAMVGERGPELVNLPRGASVTPNRALGGGGVTHNYFNGNLMTPEFWAKIQAGDNAAADAGARGGEARVFYRGSRRVA